MTALVSENTTSAFHLENRQALRGGLPQPNRERRGGQQQAGGERPHRGERPAVAPAPRLCRLVEMESEVGLAELHRRQLPARVCLPRFRRPFAEHRLRSLRSDHRHLEHCLHAPPTRCSATRRLHPALDLPVELAPHVLERDRHLRHSRPCRVYRRSRSQKVQERRHLRDLDGCQILPEPIDFVRVGACQQFCNSFAMNGKCAGTRKHAAELSMRKP